MAPEPLWGIPWRRRLCERLSALNPIATRPVTSAPSRPTSVIWKRRPAWPDCARRFWRFSAESSLHIFRFASLQPDHGDWEVMLESVGRLYASGEEIDWEAFDAPYDRARIAGLPTYPFERTRHWVTPQAPGSAPRSQSAAHPLLGRRLNLATADAIYESDWSIAGQSWLEDHRVLGRVVFPAAGFLDAALACRSGSSRFSRKSRRSAMSNSPRVWEWRPCCIGPGLPRSAVARSRRTGIRPGPGPPATRDFGPFR